MKIKTLNLKPLVVAAISMVSFLILANTSLAATTPSPEQAKCVFSQKLEELEAIKNNIEINSLEKIKLELEIRKQILKEAITCSIQETTLVKSKLEKATTDDKAIERLKNNLISEIVLSTNYYQAQSTQINNLGILGTKNLAKQVLDWRKNNYTNLVQDTAYIVSWINNSAMIEVAEGRFEDVTKIVESQKSPDQKITQLLTEAELNLAEAKSLNQKAKNTILDSNSKDEGDYFEIIKESLGELSLIYSKFFEIKELIEKE